MDDRRPPHEVACLISGGGGLKHRGDCALVISHNRILSERRETGIKWKTVAEFNEAMAGRDPCDCDNFETSI
jgi:hypothetical protein